MDNLHLIHIIYYITLLYIEADGRLYAKTERGTTKSILMSGSIQHYSTGTSTVDPLILNLYQTVRPVKRIPVFCSIL
jgi:hypothetical protein